jgi:hypothetical protein
MILPTKHLSTDSSLLGFGARLLSTMREASTVSELWTIAKQLPNRPSFERFILTLDFLFAVGAVSFDQHRLLVKRRQ